MKHLYIILLVLPLIGFGQGWEQTFGGEEDYEDDVGCSVQQTNDGGYIICGLTESFGSGDEDVYLLMTDENVEGKKCIYSGNSAKHAVIIARAY